MSGLYKKHQVQAQDRIASAEVASYLQPAGTGGFMKRFATCAAVLLLVLSTCTDLPAQKPEKNKRSGLPAAVLAAFQKAYPNAKVMNWAKERKDGKLVYEVERVDQGRGRDILYTPGGDVIEVEEEIQESDLPEAVAAAIKKQHPSARISKCEKVTRGSTIVYEIRLKGAHVHELVLNPDGTPVKTK